MKAFQVGEAGKLSAGDYEIDVLLQSAGTKEVQKSAILQDKDTGNKAGLGTKLKDISSFYDNSDNLVIESPQTITLRGNGNKADVTVSSDMTVEQFSNAMEAAITGTGEGQLGIVDHHLALIPRKVKSSLNLGEMGKLVKFHLQRMRIL